MTDFQAIRDQFSLIDVVSRYIELKKSGSEYVALCPFHEENTPSFTVYTGSDGVQRYRCFGCHAGSEGGDVLDFISAINNVDLTESSRILSGEQTPAPGSFTPKPPPPKQDKCWESIVPVPDDAPNYDPGRTLNTKHGKIVNYRPTRIDTYKNEHGKILCHVVRLEFPDGKKITPTITYCEGPGGKREWCAQRMRPPFPLQGLDELAARPMDHVLIVSGEKCKAYASKELPQLVVVTAMGGDQAVKKADITPLVGRDLIFWPDDDDTSRNSMKAMQEMVEYFEVRT